MYRHASTVGELFDLHPKLQRNARADLINILKKGLCSTPGLDLRDFKRAELDGAERARYVLAAAARGQMPGNLAAAVSAVTSASGRQTPPESDLLIHTRSSRANRLGSGWRVRWGHSAPPFPTAPATNFGGTRAPS